MTATIRLRYLAEVNPATPEFDRLAAADDVLFMPLETVWADRRLDTSRIRPKAEAATGYVRFRAGDVLCPKVTPTFQAGRSAHIGSLPDGLAAGAATTEVHVVRARTGIAEARFLRYGLLSKHFLDEGISRFQGVAGLQRVPDGFLRDLPLVHLSLDEQRRIADFLDDQVTRIDTAVQGRTRQLALLREQETAALISLATGREESGPRRESGLAWLGSIPLSWPVEPLKRLARMESGHTPSRTNEELWRDCDTPWITLNDVGFLAGNEFIKSTVNNISKGGLAASSARVLPAGTVVLSRDATVGRCGIMVVPMATSQHFVNWVCGERLRPRFLWLVMTTVLQTHFDSMTAGATIKTIGMPDIRAIQVPLPGCAEQDAIVLAVEGARQRAALLRSAVHTHRALLLERKRALITAAVTGDLDVSSAGPRAAAAVTA